MFQYIVILSISCFTAMLVMFQSLWLCCSHGAVYLKTKNMRNYNHLSWHMIKDILFIDIFRLKKYILSIFRLNHYTFHLSLGWLQVQEQWIQLKFNALSPNEINYFHLHSLKINMEGLIRILKIKPNKPKSESMKCKFRSSILTEI